MAPNFGRKLELLKKIDAMTKEEFALLKDFSERRNQLVHWRHSNTPAHFLTDAEKGELFDLASTALRACLIGSGT